MKSISAVVIVLLTIATAVVGQQTSVIHQHTTTPPDARFEIVQSELAAKWTFRLDRFTGHVSQLVTTNGGQDYTWESMLVVGLAPISNPQRPKFQIFTSGIAARHTFLMDAETGKTWTLTSGKSKDADGIEHEVNQWEPFA